MIAHNKKANLREKQICYIRHIPYSTLTSQDGRTLIFALHVFNYFAVNSLLWVLSIKYSVVTICNDNNRHFYVRIGK